MIDDRALMGINATGSETLAEKSKVWGVTQAGLL